MFVLGSQSVLMSQVDKLKILILDVEGVLVMHRQLMEDPVLKSNLLVANFILANFYKFYLGECICPIGGYIATI